MNSRERLLKAINGGIPDRVPVTLFIQDHGHFIHQLHPEIDPLDYEQVTFKVIDYQKSLGCDVYEKFILPNEKRYIDFIQDQVNLLQKGTLEEVIRVTKSTIEAGNRNGPFIIQSADFLEYNTPVENIEAFVKTALRNAEY